MKQTNRWHSILTLAIVTCLLALPMSGFAKKGRDHFNKGVDFEHAQQWEKAAQEFTLALAEDPSNIDYQLHYKRAVFNASQSFMQQGRSLAEARDYVGAYNAFRQAFGYDPVNQLAVSEMERMLRLEQVKQGATGANTTTTDANSATDGGLGGGGTPTQPPTRAPEQQDLQTKPEVQRTIIFNGQDIKNVIKTLAADLNLNVMFDRQTFAQPRPVDLNLHDVTTAKALDLLFLQEGLFFQKLDRRTILVADQARRPQYQQLVVRTFFIANSDPEKIKGLIAQALPASVGRPQPIVVPDKDTNSLTVRDTAENVKLIGELLDSLDKDRAEVVMDVNIYEVQHSDLVKIGNQIGPGDSLNMGGSPGLSILTSNATTNVLQSPGVDVSKIVAGVPTAQALALVIPPSVLSMFQGVKNSKLLASTQIHAFNNEESTARIGQRVPVQTAQAYPFGVQTGTNPTNPNGFPTGGFPVINYEPTGLTLKFTPLVYPNQDVQVKMSIESKDVANANTLTPTFTERTITGTARVQNNRTMLLASVTQDIQSVGRSGMPVLGGLPIFGHLFQSPTRDFRQVDIVIAVTPRVLRAPAVTPDDLKMRPSGTLANPTFGSIASVLRQAEREERQEQIAEAKRREQQNNTAAVLTGVVPATNVNPAAPINTAAVNTTVNTASNSVALAPVIPTLARAHPQGAAASNQRVQLDEAPPDVPAPKSAVSKQETAAVAAVNPGPGGTALLTSLPGPAKPAVDPAKPAVDPAKPAADPAKPAVGDPASPRTVRMRLGTPDEPYKAGETRRVAVELSSNVPIGMAVLALQYDPQVIAIRGVSAGTMFPTWGGPHITSSAGENGYCLVSISSQGGRAPVNGSGVLIWLEIEAVGNGSSALTIDPERSTLMATDAKDVTLDLAATTSL